MEICDAKGFITTMGYDCENGLYFNGIVFQDDPYPKEMDIMFPFNVNKPTKKTSISKFMNKKIRVRIELLED